MAAASMKRAGKVRLMAARAMVNGAVFQRLAQDLEDVARKLGQFVQESRPLWASETSPGRGIMPPPISPASEMVWWGERKGGA